MKLSVLDQSIAIAGRDEDAAVRDTLELAPYCEALGVHRFWLNERHRLPTLVGDAADVATKRRSLANAFDLDAPVINRWTFDPAVRRHSYALPARELDLVRVKGKKIPVRVYELMGRAEEPLPKEREIKRRYEGALVKFRTRDFAGAAVEFQALIEEFDDSPSKTYRAYCEERLKEPPPPDWDGSNELHEK
jgi:hypothetical protein